MSKMVDDINQLLLPRYLLNSVYPHCEGIQMEFKKSFHINQLSKYRETICAFLNTKGGHIMYGILDNGLINGCYLQDNEKDKILRYVDSMYTIMKKNNGDDIPKDCIKVYIEEIAKDQFIIIISCYRKNNDTYQFLSGDSWIRMNASNMKTTYGKLYNVQDVLNIKNKMYRKHEEIINKYKKDYQKCEEKTIIYVNNILLKKIEAERILNKNISKFNYINILFGLIIGLFTGLYFLLK
jgi:predicted HTH transcriptional regulator